MPTPIDFIVECIIKATDVKKSKPKHPNLTWLCGVCYKNVNYNNPSIECTLCKHWTHIKCTDITLDEYNNLIDRNNSNPSLIEDEPWICPKCTLINNA